MTSADARAFAARWQLVNAREERELRQTSSLQKLRQLAASWPPLASSAGPMHLKRRNRKFGNGG